MKKITILYTVLLLAFSCGKKEVKKEEEKFEEPVITDIKKNVDEVNKLDKVITEETQEIIFTVQIAALRNRNEKLENLPNVNLYQENSLTKYRLGTFKTYQEARNFRKNIIDKYNDAFVQALKNEYPISITEALQE